MESSGPNCLILTRGASWVAQLIGVATIFARHEPSYAHIDEFIRTENPESTNIRELLPATKIVSMKIS